MAWALVWLKAWAENSTTPWFPGWVWRDLLQAWSVDSTDVSAAFAHMAVTLVRLLLALLLAGAVGALIGWKTSRDPHARYWDGFDAVLGLLGGLPVFFLCFLVEESKSGIGRTLKTSSTADQWFIGVAAIAILAWGDGNGSLWVRTFRQQFERLRRAPHIVAAQARGLSIKRRLLRDVTGVLVESSGSRAVVLLSGAAIIEKMLSLDDGIGYSIISEFTERDKPSCATLAAQTFALVLVAAFLRRIDAVTRDWGRRSGSVPS